jgi:hypothetical protein
MHMVAPASIQPHLEQFRRCGFSLVRVLGMKSDNRGWALDPTGRPDYAGDLKRFCDDLARAGFRMEFNLFADTKHLPGWCDQQRQQDLYGQVVEAYRPYGWPFCLGNEIEHTGHQCVNYRAFAQPTGMESCIGSGLMDSPPLMPYWTYRTYGARRDALPDARGIANMDPYEFEAVYPQPTPLRPVESMKPENYDHDPEVARLMGRAPQIHSQEKLEAPSGFEPEMEVLQTSALPLGDGAVSGSLARLKPCGTKPRAAMGAGYRLNERGREANT